MQSVIATAGMTVYTAVSILTLLVLGVLIVLGVARLIQDELDRRTIGELTDELPASWQPVPRPYYQCEECARISADGMPRTLARHQTLVHGEVRW